ncbi:MAG: hypothetical protein Q9218_006817 [Villophora microphyllina]
MSSNSVQTSHEPIAIRIPPSLQKFAVPLSTFLATHPQYTRLACSAFIFAPKTHSRSTPVKPRLLMIQRAAQDDHFPSLWEVPGGTTEDTDPTILHSLAREVYEETGLRLTRFTHQIGEGSEFTHHKKNKTTDEVTVYKGLKLSFVIEVAEIGALLDNDGVEGFLKAIPVVLNPVEHGAFVWANEEEVREYYETGKGREGRNIVAKELAERMLTGFELVKGV